MSVFIDKITTPVRLKGFIFFLKMRHFQSQEKKQTILRNPGTALVFQVSLQLQSKRIGHILSNTKCNKEKYA